MDASNKGSRDSSNFTLGDDGEPQVTSADPNERKLARKLRIQRRLESIRKQQLPEEKVAEESSKSLLQQQLQTSAEVLEKLLIDGEEKVTNVRISNDAREVDRRESEGIGKEKIIAKLEEEAQSARDRLNEITSKWQGIIKSNDPLEIHDELSNQKEKCEEVIRQKDAIIAMLRDELKVAEANFLSNQRKQVDDVTILTQRIERQIILMRSAYRHELHLIESAILMERSTLIEANEKSWNDLFKIRQQQEESNTENLFAQIEDYEEKFRALRTEFDEKYRETKIKLENDVSNIQRELERIKSLSLINSEKLDYNYQILKKREDENIIIKSQQKRRINKLQDVINMLRNKISDVQTNHATMVEKLSDEVKKLHRCILDIESKADHFAKINNEKYCQIWKLNEARTRTVLNKILDTDRILYEHQLGKPWDYQKQKQLQMHDLASYKKAIRVIVEDERIENDIKQIRPKPDLGETNRPKDQMKETEAYRRILRHIMEKISDRSDFLIEERLKILLEAHLQEEKTLVRMDNVMTALKIKKRTDIDLLMKIFLPYTYCPICTETNQPETSTNISQRDDSSIRVSEQVSAVTTASYAATDIKPMVAAVQEPPDVIQTIVDHVTEDSKVMAAFTPPPIEVPRGECAGPKVLHEKDRDESEEETNISNKEEGGEERILCEFQHPLVIRKVYVLKALKEFISKYYVGRPGIVPMEYRLSHIRYTVSRLIEDEDVTMFWTKLGHAYTPEMEQLWTGLFEGLRKYQDILKDRKTLSEEVIALRQQNQDLRTILELHIMRNTKLNNMVDEDSG